MNRRPTSHSAGQAALAAWYADTATAGQLRTAVRYTLDLLTESAPGSAVEVRVPPAGAVQVLEGPRHTRGTPPNTVEMSMTTWLDLATGRRQWAEAFTHGDIAASGSRADLSGLLPLPLEPSSAPSEIASQRDHP